MSYLQILLSFDFIISSILILKMNNKQIKDKIQSIWKTLNSVKSIDFVQQITDSQKKANAILGKNVIQKINHVSLLKFIINELIIFAGQKCEADQHEITLHSTERKLGLQERLIKSMGRIKQIKSLLNDIGKGKKEISSQIVMDTYDFKSLTRKINILEEDLVEGGHIDRVEVISPVDTEGMEVMIEQLESLLKKKEIRIQQLTQQLEDSTYDNDQLEQEINELKTKNKSLKAANNKLTKELSKISSEYQRCRLQQKEQIFCGGTERMNSQYLVNKMETNISETTLNEQNLEQFDWNGSSAQNNNFIQKCSPPTVSKSTIKHQTAKKRFSNFTTKDGEICLYTANEDDSLDRFLLVQALVIEYNLGNILN